MIDAHSEVLHDMELLIRSRYGLIHLNTEEEDRAATLLTKAGRYGPTRRLI